MADVNVTYNQAKRSGAMSLDKDGDYLNLHCQYWLYKDGVRVIRLGAPPCSRKKLWVEVPTDIQSALVKLDAYMQTAINEDAGL